MNTLASRIAIACAADAVFAATFGPCFELFVFAAAAGMWAGTVEDKR